MRIAYMLTSLGIGGAEKQVIAIGERMAARGHQVALIVLKSAEEDEWPTSLRVYRLDVKKSSPGIIRGLARARRVLHSLNPNLLHSHTLPANMLARMLRATGTAPRVLSTIHNVYEGGWHRTLAYRITDPFCTHTTAVSRAAADRYIQINAVPRNKCSVITNGIDTDAFSPSYFRDAQRTDASRTGEKFVWLAAGRDVPAKDFDNLIAAFHLVRSAIPNAQLRIAGKPASHRSNMTDNEADGIQWLGICKDMPRTLSRCNAFVLSSAWEGLPLVVGEAMAMEKPVVATDVGGVRELTGDVCNVVPPKTPQALADAMLHVMRMPVYNRRAIGKAARLRMIQYFDVNAKADEWESLYSQILNNA